MLNIRLTGIVRASADVQETYPKTIKLFREYFICIQNGRIDFDRSFFKMDSLNLPH